MMIKPASGITAEFFDSLGRDRLDHAGIENMSQRGMLVLFDGDIPYEEFLCRMKLPGNVIGAELGCKVVNKRTAKKLRKRV